MYIRQFFRRFTHASNGIRYALLCDSSFRQQVLLGLAVLTVAFAVFFPLTIHDILFLVLAGFLILITELQNSAMEAALDRIHPEMHDNIKQSKDMAAGSVLLAGVFLLIVVGTLAYLRLIAPLLGA